MLNFDSDENADIKCEQIFYIRFNLWRISTDLCSIKTFPDKLN